MWANSCLTSARGSISNASERRKGARMFLKRNHGWLIFFETIVRFVGERERNPQSVFWRSSAGQLLILGRENTIFSLYKFTLPQLFVLTCTQFALHFHCQAGHSKLLLCPSLKCSQYHILGVIFRKEVILFPSSRSQTHASRKTPVHTLGTRMHACLCALFVFVLSKHPAVSHLLLVSWWWKAPAVLSRNPSPPYVTDILPALFTSRVVIQSLLGESRLSRHGLKGNAGRLSGSTPSSNLFLAGRKWSNNVDDFLVNLCSPCIMLFSPGCLS